MLNSSWGPEFQGRTIYMNYAFRRFSLRITDTLMLTIITLDSVNKSDDKCVTDASFVR